MTTQLRKFAANLCLIAESYEVNANTSWDVRERAAWDVASRWILDVVEVLEQGALVVEKKAPYPFCRHPEKCAGKGYCPRDPACND
jgi:hypothetical protein